MFVISNINIPINIATIVYAKIRKAILGEYDIVLLIFLILLIIIFVKQPIIVVFINVFDFILFIIVCATVAINAYKTKYTIITAEINPLQLSIILYPFINGIVTQAPTHRSTKITASKGILSKSLITIPSFPFSCPIDIIKYKIINIINMALTGTAI